MADTGFESGGRPVTLDAVESLVLWPSPFADVAVARDDLDPWPVFVVVVDDGVVDGGVADGGVADGGLGTAALTELLDRPRSPLDTITHSYCQWSVVGPQSALLRFAVRVLEPVELALDVTVPAQCFLGLSDILSAGATLGVTTRRRARRIAASVHDGRALDDVVMLGSRTSSELGLVADLLCRNENRV